jgi:hypothetical protein
MAFRQASMTYLKTLEVVGSGMDPSLRTTTCQLVESTCGDLRSGLGCESIAVEGKGSCLYYHSRL